MTGGCPFHSSDDDADDDRTESATGGSESTARWGGQRRGTVERREFVKSALLIGGASAVSALGSVAGITTNVRAAGDDSAPISAEARLNRQHAWDAYEPVGASGNTLQPPNGLVFLLDYVEAGEPSPGHRRRVERALAEIERNFEWSPAGVLFTMAYSAVYFDRFDEDPPSGARPDDPGTVVETVQELTDLADTNDDVTPDRYDAALLLASENEANLLAVEAALWGDDADISFEATFEGIFEKPDGWPARRVGFAGPEFQEREEEYEEEFLGGQDAIPDEAPLSMGFIAGFGESIPEEETVTLKRGQRFPGPDVHEGDVPTDLDYVGEVGERDPGVFAQGTLKHLSHLEIDLPTWYGESGGDDEDGDDQRRHQMYSPYHSEGETNAQGGDKPGSGLTDPDAEDPNEVAPDDDTHDVMAYADRVPQTVGGDETAETAEPTVGHSQKTARARYDVDGHGPEQPVLRRDWDSITPTGEGSGAAGYIFNVPMRFNESIYSLLDATYNVEFTSLDGAVDHGGVEDEATIKERSGIAPYMTALRRSNWLVPPITVRALPYPRAEAVDVQVEHGTGKEREETYVVTVSELDRAGESLDVDTIRFGTPEVVNKAGGATPRSVSRRSGTLTLVFPVEETDLEGGDTAKLFAKQTGSRRPVVGTATVPE